MMLKETIALTGAALIPACSVKASESPPRKEAMYWNELGDEVECELCPHKCILDNRKTGKCRTRFNDNGRLFTNAYGNPCAVHVDPIEK